MRMGICWSDGIFSDGSSTFLSNLNPKIGDKVSVKIRVFSNTGIERIMISTLLNGEESVFPMLLDYSEGIFDYYSVDLYIIHYITKYHFILVKDDEVWIYNQRGLDQHYSLKQWQFTLIAESTFPEWIHDAVFYQIFPDRFFNGDKKNDVNDNEYEKDGFLSKKKDWSNVPSRYYEGGSLDFFGGDLDGILQKIHYLKDLGINAIYLNPIFTAPSNHKYDCIDYFHVDKHFGGDEALIRLIKALHENEIKIVLDISINHVGKLHPWCTEKPGFFYYDENGNQECWSGYIDLPVLNYNCEELKNIVYRSKNSALKKWLLPPYNADGWRFDVGQSTGLMKENKLDHILWREIRKELKSVKPDSYLFTEHWDDCVSYLQGDMWDASMNYYGFTRAVRKFLGDIDRFSSYKTKNASFKSGAEILAKEVMELYSLIPYTVRMNLLNLISSHDYPRIGIVADRDIAMIVPLFLFVFPGVPCVYYGVEMNIGGYVEEDSGFRFPMEWNEDKQDKDFYNLYRFLIGYRKNSDVLKRGSFKFIYTNNDMIGIARFDKSMCVLLICSVSNMPSSCEIDLKSIGLYENCDVIKQIGECNWTYDQNTITASFADKAGVLLELKGSK